MVPSVARQLGLRGADAEALYKEADALREREFGNSVHLRALIEVSNQCSKGCAYCGIRKGVRGIKRYTLTEDEILATVRSITQGPCRTIVLQSGEGCDPDFDESMVRLLSRIKSETDLAITLSCGVRPRAVYAAWRDAGMDRYLLRFETSDTALYARMHPDSKLGERIAALAFLRTLGVQVGSGFLVGLPGETREILANNILLCRSLQLDMIGIGPFIPHPDTPLANECNVWKDDPEQFFAAVAVLRLYNPSAYIPATTAYDTLFGAAGRMRLLRCGANVYMPNCTPQDYGANYTIYPGKPLGFGETGAKIAELCAQIRGMGFTIAEDVGDAKINPKRHH